MLTQSHLREILHYSVITGQFYWLKSMARNVKFGDVAGYIDHSGYRRIEINGKSYQSHRLAWLYITGKLPKKIIDHGEFARL